MGSSVAKIQLTVTNIDALMAVQTPVFMMRNNPWTTNPNLDSKRVIQDNYSFNRTLRDMRKLLSWEELVKPKKSYVHNNWIVIEVNIKMDKPQENATVGKKRRAANPLMVISSDSNVPFAWGTLTRTMLSQLSAVISFAPTASEASS